MTDPTPPPAPPTMADVKPRDYRTPHAALSGDIKTMVTNHPDAFEVLLYRSDLASPETVAPGEDVVGALDVDERSLEYDDPVECMAMIVPDGAPFAMTLDGTRADGEQDAPIVLLLSESGVPEQSVVQWLEYVDATNLREVAVYVARSEQVGIAPGACARLYCLPMQAFGDLL